MEFALAALAFWPGMAIGSFLNVVAARVPLKQSVVRPRSTCPKCRTELAWYDNIPLVSWLVLRGLEKLRLVWNVKVPDLAQRERRRVQPGEA